MASIDHFDDFPIGKEIPDAIPLSSSSRIYKALYLRQAEQDPLLADACVVGLLRRTGLSNGLGDVQRYQATPPVFTYSLGFVL